MKIALKRRTLDETVVQVVLFEVEVDVCEDEKRSTYKAGQHL